MRDTRLFGVALGELEHLVGHVEAVRPPRLPHAPRGEDDVDAAPGAEVEDRLALSELGHRGGVAAPERGEHGRLGQVAALLGLVETAAEARAGVLVGTAASRVAGDDR